MWKALPLLFISALAWVNASDNSAQAEQSPERLRILITNDDGIQSKGLTDLVKGISSISEIVVAAPAENCSGSSHSTNIFRGNHQAQSISIEGATKAWAVKGTPADAVRWGVLMEGKEKPFDFVVSGINAGANVGEIAHYSGTVGAAMEGAGLGIPSIAVSQTQQKTHDIAIKVTVDLIKRLQLEGTPKNIVWAIEVPKINTNHWPQIKIAKMGGRYLNIKGFYTDEKDSTKETIFRSKLELPQDIPKNSNTDLFLKGFVVITPLLFDWTANKEMQRLMAWNWSAPLAQ